jgi:hypothetical protein
MHQTVGNVLRTLLHGEPPQNIAAMHAMRVGIHTTLGNSLGNEILSSIETSF